MPRIEKYLEYPQDTRWATDEEIMSPISSTRINIEHPPFSAGGLILKSDGKTAYVDGLDNHSMILGSTGSGKSRLICMPMIGVLANAGESFIATDPKGELYQMTSGLAREQGYQVVVLNFRDVSSGDMWNPLLIPYELYQKGEKDKALSLVNDLVMALTAAENSTQERFWTQMAQSLILANILLLFETARREEVNMYSLSRLCQDYGKAQEKNELYQLLEYINPDSIAGMNYTGVCIDAEKTRSSIMGVVHSVLRVFSTQEGLLRMMADSSFDIRSFGTKKTAVYLIVPDEKSTFHFLVSTFTKQCYEMLIESAHRKKNMKLPVRVNFVLDEFANLPTIPDMPNMISAARSRNIRFHLVIQSMNQLASKYGRDAETISSNCENWVYLNSKEYDCLEEISKRCGNLLDNRNQIRPLITPSRLQRLDKKKGEVLIFHGRHYPYISYLADISRYHFRIVEPMRLDSVKRPAVSVFHVGDLLRKVKAGDVEPLFYEKEQETKEEAQTASSDEPFDRLMENMLGGHREPLQSGKAGKIDSMKRPLESVEEILQRLRRERMALAGQNGMDLEVLSWLAASQPDLQKVEELLAEDPGQRRQYGDCFEAEDTYRSAEYLCCYLSLAGRTVEHPAMHLYQEWLLETAGRQFRRMIQKKRELAFQPVSRTRQQIVVIGGMGLVLHWILQERYGEAEELLQYVGSYREVFFRYPDLQELYRYLEEMFQMVHRLALLWKKAGMDDSPAFWQEKSLLEENKRNIIRFLDTHPAFETAEEDSAVIPIFRRIKREPESEQEKESLQAVCRMCSQKCEKLADKLRDRHSADDDDV